MTAFAHDPADVFCGCPVCVQRDLDLVAAMCRPIPPDTTRAMAVLAALVPERRAA